MDNPRSTFRQTAPRSGENRLCWRMDGTSVLRGMPMMSPDAPEDSKRIWDVDIGSWIRGLDRRSFGFMNESANAETLKRLNDHSLWLQAFREDVAVGSGSVSIFTAPKQELPPTGAIFGPREFLLSVDPEQRQELYVEYIDRFIPRGIQSDIVKATRDAGKMDAGVTIPPGLRLPPGTYLPSGTVLPPGTILPNPDAVVPEPPADITWAGSTIDPSFIPPRGLVLPAGATIPAGTIIPGAVIRGDWEKMSAKERWQDVRSMTDRFNAITGGIMGIEKPDRLDAQEKEWAKQSLSAYFEMQMSSPSLGVWRDIDIALEQQRLSGFDPASTTPDLLLRNMPASRMRGALALGVIEQPQLAALLEMKKNYQHERALEVGRNTRYLDAIRKATDHKLRNEAMTMRDTWDNLGGGEKFALFLIGGYLLTKSSFRNMAITLGVGYFAQKFLFKSEDPIATWSAWLNKPTNWLSKKNQEMFGEWAVGYAPDLEERAKIMLGFLSDSDRQHVETQARGFSLLADVPMNLLAQNFEIAPDGHTWILDASQGGNVDRSMQNAAEKYGWAKDYSEFFQDPINVRQVSDAVAFSFYCRAAKDPKHRKSVEMVEEAMRMLPAGLGYSGLRDYRFDPTLETIDGRITPEVETRIRLKTERMQAASIEYDRLVAAGRELSIGDTTPLGSFVEDLMGLRRKPAVAGWRTRTKEEEEKKRREELLKKVAAPVRTIDVPTATLPGPVADAMRAEAAAVVESRNATTAAMDARKTEAAEVSRQLAAAQQKAATMATSHAAEPAMREATTAVAVHKQAQEVLTSKNARDTVTIELDDLKMPLITAKAEVATAQKDVDTQTAALNATIAAPDSSTKNAEIIRLRGLVAEATNKRDTATASMKPLEDPVAAKEAVLAIETKKVEVAEKEHQLAVAQHAEAVAVLNHANAVTLEKSRETGVAELNRQVAAAEKELRDLQAASPPAAPAAIAAAKTKLETAQQQQAEAARNLAESTASVRTAETQIATAKAEVAAAEKAVNIATAETAVTRAEQALRAAEKRRADSQKTLNNANDSLANAERELAAASGDATKLAAVTAARSIVKSATDALNKAIQEEADTKAKLKAAQDELEARKK